MTNGYSISVLTIIDPSYLYDILVEELKKSGYEKLQDFFSESPANNTKFHIFFTNKTLSYKEALHSPDIPTFVSTSAIFMLVNNDIKELYPEFVIRFGGEEIILVATNDSSQEGRNTGRKLRDAIKQKLPGIVLKEYGMETIDVP